jgi:hypothetical protein
MSDNIALVERIGDHGVSDGPNHLRDHGMRLLVLLVPLVLGGCFSFSSSNPPPPAAHSTIVLPPNTTVVCSNGQPPPCQ